jgi:MoaA/NifB/PqqE/SkfB family radical SAM enzyme
MDINNSIKKFNKTRNKLYRDSLCHAPFNSITFEPLGYVKNCCSSHEPIGKYPNLNITNIINSETNTRIKYNLDKMIFPANCKDCETMLSIGSFNNTMINLYDNFDFINNQGISDIAFSLENTCNLKCIMCNSYKSSKHAKQNETKGYYDEAFFVEIEPFLLNLKSANFTGGEPFLIEMNYKIWNFIAEHNPTCSISITTNGTILNDKIKNIIAKGNFHFNVSIDAIDPKLYENIRIGATHKNMQDNLNFFIKYSKERGYPLNLSICPMQINIEELPKIGKYTKENNLGFFLNPIIAPYKLALWSLEDNLFKDTIRYLKNNNPFRKNDQAYIVYVELIKNLKKWSEREQILEKQDHINREIFLNRFYETLIIKKVNEEKAASMRDVMKDFDKKFYTEQLIQQFQSISEYYIKILNSPLIEDSSMEFFISNYIYYSIFSINK